MMIMVVEYSSLLAYFLLLLCLVCVDLWSSCMLDTRLLLVTIGLFTSLICLMDNHDDIGCWDSVWDFYLYIMEWCISSTTWCIANHLRIFSVVYVSHFLWKKFGPHYGSYSSRTFVDLTIIGHINCCSLHRHCPRLPGDKVTSGNYYYWPHQLLQSSSPLSTPSWWQRKLKTKTQDKDTHSFNIFRTPFISFLCAYKAIIVYHKEWCSSSKLNCSCMYSITKR